MNDMIFVPDASPLALIRDITGDERWHADDCSGIPYQTYLRLEPARLDLSFYAAIHGLYAVATRVKKTSPLFFIEQGQVNRQILSRAFELESQWEGDELQDRAYLRAVLKGDQGAEGTRLSMLVICDQWGNALRNNKATIQAAIATYRAQHQSTPAQQLAAGLLAAPSL